MFGGLGSALVVRGDLDRIPEVAAAPEAVLVQAGEELRIRVTFRDFKGRTVYHCHNPDHKDLGLMGVLQIDAVAG